MNKLEQINHIISGVGMQVGRTSDKWWLRKSWLDSSILAPLNVVIRKIESVYDSQCPDITGDGDCECEDWDDVFENVKKLMKEVEDESK